MTTDIKGSNIKLHEFRGEPFEIQELEKLYNEFFSRSKPLELGGKTLSSQTSKRKEYFEFLVRETKILFAAKGSEILFFISFDPQLKSLEWPNPYFAKEKCCEFVFAASRNFNKKTFSEMASKAFFWIKEHYGVKYIVGNVRRKHKKKQFMNLAAKTFGFKFIGDFTYLEIPQSL